MHQIYWKTGKEAAASIFGVPGCSRRHRHFLATTRRDGRGERRGRLAIEPAIVRFSAIVEGSIESEHSFDFSFESTRERYEETFSVDICASWTVGRLAVRPALQICGCILRAEVDEV